jgi:asparagine synthase (glutamine-hydrolysing)
MAGIYGILGKHNADSVYKYFFTYALPNITNEEYSYGEFTYGRSVLSKFLNDRILFEDDDFIIGFEGLFFNKDEQESFNTIKKWYRDKGIDFVKRIKGQFCGFIYDKKKKKLFVYSDHLSTKPLYYYANNELFIFSSELKVITKILNDLKVSKVLDYDAVYSMITFGYMLNDTTYEINTKKLQHSTILTVDSNYCLSSVQYYSYIKKENFNLSKNEIINTIDKLLLKSVKNCWEKDREYGYQHFSFLSGGLDSRVNLFLAKELGYSDINTITFSQSGSSDHTIAKKKSKKENFKHTFYPLDNGKYLEGNYQQYVDASDGLAILSGSAAGFNIMSNFENIFFGLLHTGQIGDVLFGSFINDDYDIQEGMIK